MNDSNIQVGSRIIAQTVFNPFPQTGTVIGKHPEGKWQVKLGEGSTVLLRDSEMHVLSDVEYLALAVNSCSIG